MNPPTMDVESLGQRLDRLERENRWLKRLGGVMLLGVTALVLMGQATPRRVPKIIEAEEFILRDGTGKLRAAMGVAPGGIVRLQFFDNHGRTGLALGVPDDGLLPMLALSDNNGKPSAVLHLRADGLPELRLTDKDGKTRARLGLMGDGNPALLLSDKDDKYRVVLGQNADGAPSLELLDEKERLRAVLGHIELERTRAGSVEQRPASSLVLFDKEGKVIWKAP